MAMLATADVVGTRWASVSACLGLSALICGADGPGATGWHRRCACALWCASAVALAWIPVSLWDPFTPKVAVGVWLVLSAYNAVSLFVALAGCAWLRRRGARWTVTLPPALLVAELVRAHALGGLDWLALGGVAADTPVFQHMYGVVGVNGVTALLAGFVGVAADLRVAGGRTWLGPWLIMIALCSVPCPCGSGEDGETLTVGVPLADEAQRFESAAQRLADAGIPLILGPEANSDTIDHVAALGAALLVGYQRPCEDDAFHLCHENGVSSLDPTGRLLGAIRKRRFVPIYERAFGPIASVGRRVMLAGDGDGVLAAADTRAGVVICYEALFADLFAEAMRGGAQWIFHPTSDAWQQVAFGRNQHVRVAQIRAAEFGVSVVRVARRGPSVHIDPHGAARTLVEDLPGTAAATLAVELGGRATLIRRHSFAITAGLALAAVFALVAATLAVRKDSPC